MSARRPVVVATAWLTTLAGAALVFAVRPEKSFTGDGASFVLAGLVLATASDASVGAILMLKRPGNVIGLVLMLAAILSSVTLFGWVSGAALAERRGHDDLLAGVASLVGVVGFFPTLFVGGPLLALLFPTGRLPSRRWRWPVGGILAAIAIPSAIGLRYPGTIANTLVHNPFGASEFSGSEAFFAIGITLLIASLPAAFLLAVAAVIVRFRRSTGIERAQLKWFVAATFAVATLLALGFADGGLDVGLAAGISPTIFDVLAVASLSLPPLAVGVAILRYRLFEIDRIISRTIAWAVVTGVLGAVFAVTVVGLQTVLSNVTQGDTLAVAGSTLVAFALFQPVRRRIQDVVDRQFNRARYDAHRTTLAFAEQLRNEVDPDRLSTALVDIVEHAMRPASASVWLRSPEGIAGR